MATYDLTRTQLGGLLDGTGYVDPGVRDQILAMLEDAGVYTGDPDSTAHPSAVPDGDPPDPDSDAVVYNDASGFTGVPSDATAVVFATSDDVIAAIGGPGGKILVSGRGDGGIPV